MRTGAGHRRSLFALAACAFAAGALLVPAKTGAWTYDRRAYRGWDSATARSLQSRAISGAAEARREGQRQVNRSALQERQADFQSAFLASQRAIREGARAARRAPRDAFFRRPGFSRSSMTPGTVEIEVDGRTFFYDRGIFFRHLVNQYVVVPAPPGAVVDTLPRGTEAAMLGDDFDTYFYFFGTFFARRGDKYEVVAPTPGVKVWYVPDGYTEIEQGDGVRFQFGDHTFEPVYWKGNVVFRVV